MPICEVGQAGEKKTREGGEKKRKKARAGRLGPGLKHKLGVIHPGAELSAKIYGSLAPSSLPCHLHVGLEPKSSTPGTLAPMTPS